MSNSPVVTVRMPAELRAALRAYARRTGTTVSATITALVRKAVVVPPRTGKRRSTMGMFSGFEAPPTLEEFKRARRELGAQMLASVRRA